MNEEIKACCELCGELLPKGEQMFKRHGYSSDCPKPPKVKIEEIKSSEEVIELQKLAKDSDIKIKELETVIDKARTKLDKFAKQVCYCNSCPNCERRKWAMDIRLELELNQGGKSGQ